MTQQEVFGGAKWIAAGVPDIEAAPVIRKSFEAVAGERAHLRVIGFGTFVAYLNGRRISDDYFLPLASEYEKTEFPVGEELSGFRTYVTEYDVSEYLVEGKNVLALLIGGGWYTGVHYGIRKIYGEKKAIFSLTLGEGNSARRIGSDGTELWHPSFVVTSDINKGESHDYNGWSDDMLGRDFDDFGWGRVRFSDPVDTEYCFTDCPADKIALTLPVREVCRGEGFHVYDCGYNTSGYPVIISREGFVGKIEVAFSEALNKDGTDIDENHVFWQEHTFAVDGRRTEIYPRFTWYGFRYFRVKGECDCTEVKVVHAGVEVSSSFRSSDETLNWIYDAFINTQLTNMHRGVPSDCPHIERLGYTGDGQLACRSALMTLAAKEFYRKWIKDISDCQDKLTGRVQYCAPYYYCGGGPGGWGCAIVVVPYEYYKYYGDDTYIKELYPQMLRFLDFLEEHSEAGLVTSYKEGVWCLGDWCTPPAGGHKEGEPLLPRSCTLPTPFVNTYFRVWTTMQVVEIAKIIGKTEDIPALEADIAKCKRAIDTFYFNGFFRDDCYCANTQGAGAFALGIGLGTENTREKFINYYDKLGYYDTGIFATELVTRRLFELGRADVAYKLLTASEPHGFGKWREIGSTTLREYWTEPCRSYSHPMFGAVVATFFEYILGIRQREGTVGWTDIVVSPAEIAGLADAAGHITTPQGKIAVSYKTVNGKKTYTVEIPEGTTARIELGDIVGITVGAGRYTF